MVLGVPIATEKKTTIFQASRSGNPWKSRKFKAFGRGDAIPRAPSSRLPLLSASSRISPSKTGFERAKRRENRPWAKFVVFFSVAIGTPGCAAESLNSLQGRVAEGCAPCSGGGTGPHRLLLCGSSLTGWVPTALMSAEVAQTRNRAESLSCHLGNLG
jgi:hypothetical protein